MGSQLAPCLTEDSDGLKIVFGNQDNKKSLDDLYENWPLVRSGTIALEELLEKAMANPSCPAKFRMLEVGRGTGDTTKYIVPTLRGWVSPSSTSSPTSRPRSSPSPSVPPRLAFARLAYLRFITDRSACELYLLLPLQIADPVFYLLKVLRV